jgi:hypothetical protein
MLPLGHFDSAQALNAECLKVYKANDREVRRGMRHPH